MAESNARLAAAVLYGVNTELPRVLVLAPALVSRELVGKLAAYGGDNLFAGYMQLEHSFGNPMRLQRLNLEKMEPGCRWKSVFLIGPFALCMLNYSYPPENLTTKSDWLTVVHDAVENAIQRLKRFMDPPRLKWGRLYTT